MKVAATLVLSAAVAYGQACCGVSSTITPVVFDGQTDIVVWDSERKTEHFIRNARFKNDGDIGFLAPTPSIPKLSSVTKAAFERLTNYTVPPQWVRSQGGFGGGLGSGESEPSKPVVVVEMVDVGSYTAAVLQAGDAKALEGWLKENGFPAPEWLESWVKPYLENEWTITAFKLKKGATRATGPVRMSFETDTPFAPYAVPKENGGSGSKLRLFLVSDVPLKGEVGGEPWAAKKIGGGVLDKSSCAILAKDLGLRPGDLPLGMTVTTFDDLSFGLEPRHDLFFVSSEGHTAGKSLSLVLLTVMSSVVGFSTVSPRRIS